MAVIFCETYKNHKILFSDYCITFGIFDGVHQGHQLEIDACKTDAKLRNKKSAIVTFDIDPDEIFKSDFVKLQSNEERIITLENSGVDDVIVVKFNKELQNCDAEKFLDVFFGNSAPASIHVGKGFKFGKKQSGNTELLETWGHNHNMDLVVHDLFTIDGKVLSSTLLRKKELEKG